MTALTNAGVLLIAAGFLVQVFSSWRPAARSLSYAAVGLVLAAVGVVALIADKVL